MSTLFKYDFTAAPEQIGEPVAFVQDVSGNGYALAQTTPARQPVKGAGHVRFNGSFMSCPGVDLSGLQETTIVVACRYFGTPTGVIVEHGTAPLASGGFGVYCNNGRSTLGAGIGNGAGAYRFNNCDPANIVGTPAVLTAIIRPGAASPADRVNLRLNGVDVTDVVSGAVGTTSADLFKSQTLYIGARAGSSLFANVDMFGAQGFDSALSGQDLDDAEAWALSLLPIPVGNQRVPDMHTSSYSQITYQTDATAVEIDVNCTIATTYAAFAQIGVSVDGAQPTPIPVPQGASTHTISLALGTKELTITSGPQSKPNGTVLGTWITAVRANAPLIGPPAEPRGIIYGDSIAAGDAASPVQQASWAMLVRDAVPHELRVEAYGYRALHDDCATDAGIQAFVDGIARQAPTVVWLAVGTNDCALGKWSAAAFGTAYAKLLDALHAQMPWLTVVAQSPTVRTNYVAEIAAFRSAIESACSGRSWVQYVDGTQILTTADLADNVHPSTAGHAKYASAVLSILQGLLM